jgi:hypothetical protein
LFCVFLLSMTLYLLSTCFVFTLHSYFDADSATSDSVQICIEHLEKEIEEKDAHNSTPLLVCFFHLHISILTLHYENYTLKQLFLK